LIRGRIAYTVYAILGAFTLNELLGMAEKTGAKPVKWISLGIYATAVMAVYQWLFHSGEMLKLWILLLFFLALIAFVIEVFRKNPRPLESISASLVSPAFA